jgi:hypothetical protein
MKVSRHGMSPRGRVKAGFRTREHARLTPASYCPSLPGRLRKDDQCMRRGSFSLTAAGQSRTSTGFPFSACADAQAPTHPLDTVARPFRSTRCCREPGFAGDPAGCAPCAASGRLYRSRPRAAGRDREVREQRTSGLAHHFARWRPREEAHSADESRSRRTGFAPSRLLASRSEVMSWISSSERTGFTTCSSKPALSAVSRSVA